MHDETSAAEEAYDAGLDLLAANDAPAAAHAFRTALGIDATFLDARHGLIRALKDMQAYDEAIEQAHALAEQAPEDVLAHTALSILYQHKGMIPEAEAAATRAKLLDWKLQLRESNFRRGSL